MLLPIFYWSIWQHNFSWYFRVEFKHSHVWWQSLYWVYVYQKNYFFSFQKFSFHSTSNADGFGRIVDLKCLVIWMPVMTMVFFFSRILMFLVISVTLVTLRCLVWTASADGNDDDVDSISLIDSILNAIVAQLDVFYVRSLKHSNVLTI